MNNGGKYRKLQSSDDRVTDYKKQLKREGKDEQQIKMIMQTPIMRIKM